jgi:GTP-binding protein
LINFFRCGDRGFLVDLPGYGYAQVPEAVRRGWQGALEHYLRKRKALVGLVLIMDVRHPVTPLDRQMLGWFASTGRPVHVILTKADKLTRGEGVLTLQRVRLALAQYPLAVSVQLFSSLRRIGLEEAEAVVLGWFDGRQAEKKAPG